MPFPINVTSEVASYNGTFERSLTLHRGLTVILGPNGSGKTHLLRGLKRNLAQHVAGKKVRFLSAGRMGLLEQYRSDYDGQRGSSLRYEQAEHGSKSDVKHRHQTETLDGDFQTLSERSDILIKVQERLRKLFNRDIIIEWDAGSLKITFARLNVDSKPYTSGREASGLLHLVGILAALYDDEVGALLIDEPEVSLHPQLQAFLLKEMMAAAGDPEQAKKIIVIATHSTEMVRLEKAGDLLSLVFCYDLNDEPVQIAPEAGELQNRKVQSLLARLGQEHKLSLFSKRPLLVEGPSDVMICTALSSKTDLHLEAAGSQLLPVIGKGQMPVVSKLLRLLGKDPVVLADADGIADGLDLINTFLSNNSAADCSARSGGAGSATQMASSIYNDFCRLASESWGEISAVAEQHPYWLNRAETSEDQAKRRAAFCALFDEGDAASALVASSPDWVAIKQRLIALLELLEEAGCFILRRGSIEAYYQAADRFTSIEKPRAAADEMEYIEQLSADKIYALYADVMRCINYAANVETICEAEALRDILLAVAAPSLGKLRSGGRTQDIQILAKSLLGERSNIFDYEVKSGVLIISLKSKVLDVVGFPMTLCPSDDVVGQVTQALGLDA